MTTIYLARHGESDWNAANRFQGLSDRPLTELGRRQAEALADQLAATASPSAIYSSPLRRAFETAAIVGTRTGLEPRPVDDLREVDVGGWAGLSRSAVDSPAGSTTNRGGRTARATPTCLRGSSPR